MNLHFIAIGGSIMHNLAISLRKKNYKVTGSDDQIYDPAASKLKKYGILPENPGWYPEKIHKDLDAVILGMHAKKDNPELLRAQELGIKIYSFPEYVFEQSKNKKRIVVGGSHGKTSITSMIMHVLTKTGKEFDFLVGSELDGFELMVQLSDAPLIVIEGDEYLASPLLPIPKFHLYRPHIAIISGIAWDHFNVFPTFENYKNQFQTFIEKIENGGYLFYSGADPELVNLVNQSGNNNIHIKAYKTPDYTVKDGLTTVHFQGKNYPLQIFGKHNLQNMEAAHSVCHTLGIDDEEFYTAMQSFSGAAKRMETIVNLGNLKIYRDFAHAPSKLKASVSAVKEQYPDYLLVAVFELHTFSSLNKGFIEQYKYSMENADKAVVLLDPKVLEHKNLPPVSDDELRGFFQQDNLNIVHNKTELIEFLGDQKAEKKVVLMMSSGTFDGLDIKKVEEVSLQS